MVILSALQWKCSSLGVIALCGCVFWLCFQIPALILLQWDVTWGVHYCRYCTVEGIREIQCQKWTVGLRTVFMGLYMLGISYLLLCYCICKGTHDWFGCISVAEDISELCNGFCGAAVLCSSVQCTGCTCTEHPADVNVTLLKTSKCNSEPQFWHCSFSLCINTFSTRLSSAQGKQTALWCPIQ